MTRLCLVALLALVPACPEHGKGNGGDDVCFDQSTGFGEPHLRNPSDLICVAFNTTCDPSCGPCEKADGVLLPPWGACPSECDTLGETQCKAAPGCRVARDAGCTVGGNTCFTDFLGCFSISRSAPANPCFKADAETCASNAMCEAHHRQTACPSGECARPFVACTPAGQSPGHCTGQVTCDAATPSCPPGTTPGILNGCFTGACIVTSACP